MTGSETHQHSDALDGSTPREEEVVKCCLVHEGSFSHCEGAWAVVSMSACMAARRPRIPSCRASLPR